MTLRHRSGFTMVELLVVIGIIILLAGISIPAFMTLFKSRALRDGARIAQMNLQRAQAEAIAKRRPMLVRFYKGRRKVVGTDVEDKKVVSEEPLWWIQIVDSDGDDDLVLDEDGDGQDFLKWPEGNTPDADKPPPRWQEPSAQATPNHIHPQPEDDRIVAEDPFPEGIEPTPGKDVGNPGAVDNVWFVLKFMPDGRVEKWKPDFAAQIPDVLSRNFKDTTDPAKGPENCHDFAVQNAQGEKIYFDIVTATGRAIPKEALK